MPTHNFRLSCLVTMVTILLGSHISFTSARHTEKRDAYMGLEMMCKLHPRNCPGGLLLKREESLINRLRRIFPNDVYSGTNPNANPTNNNERSETAFVLEDDDDEIPSGSIDILPNSLSSSASASSLNDLGNYPAAPVERRDSRDVVERPMARLLDMLRSYRARQQQHQQQQLQQQSSYRKRKV